MSTKRNARRESLVEEASFSSIDLFRGLPDEALKAIEEKSAVRDYRAGHVFFRPGETGQVLFLLETGHVQTFRTTGQKRLIVAELKPPSIFGEMGCVGQCMYYCSAQATEPSRIRVLSRENLEELMDRYPQIVRRMLELMSNRFLHVLMDLEATSSRNLIPRLAKLLLQRAEGDHVRDMTHKEIAEHLHVYRESATTALGELRKAGIVAIERKQIRILDQRRLERATRE